MKQKMNTQKSLPGIEAIPKGTFMKRWKQGMASIPPINLSKIAIRGSWITIIGFLIGIYLSIISYMTLWWLGIILCGGLINSIVALIGQYKTKWAYQKIDKTMKELNCGLGELV